MGFFDKFIRNLMDTGHTVEIATNESDKMVPACYREWGCKIHHIACSRVPFSKGNLTAIRQIKELVNNNGYDIVHCHTPVAAMCTRLACIGARKQGTRVFYTAHGFHFYKGAPLKNWLLYFPVEWICAHFTDVLITINQEDYALANKCMRAKKVAYVPGVGIELDKFTNTVVERDEKRASLGIPNDATLLLSVGELNENKNHQVIIRAMAHLNDPQICYAIAGAGAEADKLMALAKELGLEQKVYLLGYRTDVAELCHAADLFCFPSHREGLGLAAIEAMACGLFVIAADNRGTREFIVDSKNGILCQANDVYGFAEAIKKFRNAGRTMNIEGNMEILKSYAIERIICEMRMLYFPEMER